LIILLLLAVVAVVGLTAAHMQMAVVVVPEAI
jgi:hypothetical protein